MTTYTAQVVINGETVFLEEVPANQLEILTDLLDEFMKGKIV